MEQVQEEQAQTEQGQAEAASVTSTDMAHLQKDLKQIEEEAYKLQNQVDQLGAGEESADADSRSIHVGNVDFSSTPEELQSHFQECGTINRVTILCDKYTGHPKGFAYIEFAEEASVTKAAELNDSLFKGRQIKVNPKRANVPGYGRGRGRGAFVRGGYRPFRPRGRFGRRFNPYFRGRGF
eukprot:c14342_g1_i1.p1 GENE.c14342_g1_i1~~c14342_g1_i1.p1  ORF type:complete len:195 (-),score=85.18 c14342_g1_i1:66-608(-)